MYSKYVHLSLLRRESIVSAMFVMFLFFVVVDSVPLGRDDEESVPPIDAETSYKQDELLSRFLEDEIPQKPSLGYLHTLASGKNALVIKDYYDGLYIFTDMYESYGGLAEIVFGLGEAYFYLSDQSNAMLFYSQLFEVAKGNEGREYYVFNSHEGVLASYRVAYLHYQQGNIDEYENTLLRILNASQEVDYSTFALFDAQSLDYVVDLNRVALDSSFVARREIGVFYEFNRERILERRIMKRNDSNQNSLDVYREDAIKEEFNREVVGNLITALGMVTSSLTSYIQERNLGYTFTDLSYMIEILNQTSEGRTVLNKFDLSRIILALRKNYELLSETDPKHRFGVIYCTELLHQMFYFENTASSSVYEYYSNLQ